MKITQVSRACAWISLVSLLSGAAHAQDLLQSITGGKLDASLRYRFEHVHDDLAPGGVPLKDANASTLRTTVGYQTADFHGWSAHGELQWVTKVFGGRYFDGSNRNTAYATVVDPAGLELNRGYLSYTGISATRFQAGRQIITYRDAPFHRFIGNVLWRQNWQTFDAVTFTNTSLMDTKLSYAYVWRVNRIFGEDAPGPLSHFDSNSHFVNLQYTGLALGKLEAYVYLLDFNNAAAFSTETYGARFSGDYPLTGKIKGLYALEYAKQFDYANNPSSIDANYVMAEAGFSYQPGNLIDNITIKFDFELLSGDGGADRFVTILGTNHAYQGWDDRFLITPGDGIRDYYLTSIIKLYGVSLTLSYHDINSDHLDYGYGRELDAQLLKTFLQRYSVGVKYGRYQADRNILNSGATAADTDKFWIWVQVKFP